MQNIKDSDKPETEQNEPVKEEKAEGGVKDSIANYKDIKVTFLKFKKSTLSTYMVYTLSYSNNGKTHKLERRFSDFVSLREVIRKQIPCHFIFPTHRKKNLV